MLVNVFLIFSAPFPLNSYLCHVESVAEMLLGKSSTVRLLPLYQIQIIQALIQTWEKHFKLPSHFCKWNLKLCHCHCSCLVNGLYHASLDYPSVYPLGQVDGSWLPHFPADSLTSLCTHEQTLFVPLNGCHGICTDISLALEQIKARGGFFVYNFLKLVRVGLFWNTFMWPWTKTISRSKAEKWFQR